MILSLSPRLPIILLISLVLLKVSGANAKPPRYAQIHDTPIAASATHLFLFRNIIDNQGSYYIRETKRFLVSQRLSNGVIDQHWNLGETSEGFVNECLHPCIESTKPARTNPFIVFENKNASVVDYWPYIEFDDEGEIAQKINPVAKLSSEGLVYLENEHAELIYTLKQLSRKISASLDPTFKILPKEEDNPVNPTEFLQSIGHVNLRHCVPTFWYSNLDRYMLFSINCDSQGEEFVSQYRVFVTAEFND